MIKPRNLKKKKEKVHDIASDLYSDQFEKYYDGHEELLDATKINSIPSTSL